MTTSNRSAAYWQQRRLRDKILSQFYIEDQVGKADALYRRQIDSLRQQIDDWYQRYGIAGQLPLSLSTDQLTRRESRDVLRQVALQDPYTQHLLKDADLSHLTRLQSLELSLQKELYTLFRADEVLMAESLQHGAIDGYTHTDQYLDEMLSGHYNRPNMRAVQQLLQTSSESWIGNRNWSERLWGHRADLGEQLHQVLESGVTQGWSQDRMIRQFQESAGGARGDVARLIRTETAHIYEQGTYAAYEEAGVETYRYMATLDIKTSTICASLDGKVFRLSDAEPGLNYPPMHPNCRSTTIPSRVEPRERIARDAEGNNIMVPGDMTYDEWLKSDPTLATQRKAWSNRSGDAQQLQRYQEVMGRDAPRNLAEFQRLKYNEPEQYQLMRHYNRAVNSGWVTTLVPYRDYAAMDQALSGLNGRSTAGGITITGHSLHFIDRVFGVYDYQTGKARNGVTLSEVEQALTAPQRIGNVKSSTRTDGRVDRSVVYYGATAAVSINPDTGNLVQCNPYDTGR